MQEIKTLSRLDENLDLVFLGKLSVETEKKNLMVLDPDSGITINGIPYGGGGGGALLPPVVVKQPGFVATESPVFENLVRTNDPERFVQTQHAAFIEQTLDYIRANPGVIEDKGIGSIYSNLYHTHNLNFTDLTSGSYEVGYMNQSSFSENTLVVRLKINGNEYIRKVSMTIDGVDIFETGSSATNASWNDLATSANFVLNLKSSSRPIPDGTKMALVRYGDYYSLIEAPGGAPSVALEGYFLGATGSKKSTFVLPMETFSYNNVAQLNKLRSQWNWYKTVVTNSSGMDRAASYHLPGVYTSSYFSNSTQTSSTASLSTTDNGATLNLTTTDPNGNLLNSTFLTEKTFGYQNSTSADQVDPINIVKLAKNIPIGSNGTVPQGEYIVKSYGTDLIWQQILEVRYGNIAVTARPISTPIAAALGAILSFETPARIEISLATDIAGLDYFMLVFSLDKYYPINQSLVRSLTVQISPATYWISYLGFSVIGSNTNTLTFALRFRRETAIAPPGTPSEPFGVLVKIVTR